MNAAENSVNCSQWVALTSQRLRVVSKPILTCWVFPTITSVLSFYRCHQVSILEDFSFKCGTTPCPVHLTLQLFQLLRREQHGWGAAGLYWTSSEGVVDLGAGSSGTGDVASMRAGLRMIGRDMGGTPTCRGEARGCRMRGDWPKGEGPWTGEVVNGTGMGGIEGGTGDDRPDPGTQNERTQ